MASLSFPWRPRDSVVADGLNEAGLTVDALHQILEAEIHRADSALVDFKAYMTSLAAERQRAQDKFEETVREGFVKQNEFRGALEDLGRTMTTRREAEAAGLGFTQRLDAQQEQITELRSRLDVGPSGLNQLQLQQAQQSGLTLGKRESQSALYAMIAAVGGVLGIVIVLSNVLTN